MRGKADTNFVVDRYRQGLKAQRNANHNYWVNSAFLR